MQKHSLLIMIALLPLPVMALDAPEYGGWQGNATFGGVITGGNADTSSIHADVNEEYNSKQWLHRLNLSVLDARDSGDATVQRYVGAYRFQFEVLPNVGFFTDLRFVRDEFSGFNRQVYETLGYSRRFVDSLFDILDVELGVGLTQQLREDGVSEDSVVGRTGFTYVHEYLNGNLFKSNLLVLAGRDNTSSEFKGSVTAKLLGDIGLEIGQSLRYNSSPQEDREQLDTTTNVGLVYDF